MRIIFSVLSFLLAISANPAYASIDPSTLTKVTKDNNPNCVEYFSYKGEMYCSTTPQTSEPIDPHLKDTEKQHIVFDQRAWQAVWGKTTPTITTIEYVPAGDNINAWHELITSIAVSGLSSRVTPKMYADKIIEGITKSGFTPIVTFIEENPEKVIFEYRIETPTHLKQDVLEVIKIQNDVFYLLQYAIKEADMGQDNRDKWIRLLKESSILK